MARRFTRAVLALCLLPCLLLCTVPAFADFLGDKGRTLKAGNDSSVQSFTISKTTSFTLYFAADFRAQVLVMDASLAQSFSNGGSVSYYGGFDGQFGITNFTLQPGSYVVGLRNLVNNTNVASWELETVPVEVSGATYNDTYFKSAETVTAGATLWQPFTVQAGYSYVIEGCNTGLEYYLIPASSLANFRSNSSFNYYPGYSGSGTDTNMPGLFVVSDLPPGDYYLAFRNSTSQTRAVTYVMYRYRESVDGGGGAQAGTAAVSLVGTSGYSLSNSILTLSSSRIVNGGTASSGALQLSLWATAAPYSGGTLTGYRLGMLALNSLAPEYEYKNITMSVPYTAPPAATYNMLMTLEESRQGKWYIVDYANFNNRATISGGSAGVIPTPVLPIFQGGTLTLPAVRVGLVWYNAGMTLVPGSQPYQFILASASATTAPTSGTQASYTGGLLGIPDVQVGTEHYAVEMEMINAQPLTFRLRSARKL